MILPGKRDAVEQARKGLVVPVYATVLADTETPVSVWLKLFAGRPNSFLLESVTGGDTVEPADLPPLPPAEKEKPHQSHVRPDRRRRVSDQIAAERPDHNPADMSLLEMEKGHILSLLEKTKWNVTEAAALAGLKRTTFTSRMKKRFMQIQERTRYNMRFLVSLRLLLPPMYRRPISLTRAVSSRPCCCKSTGAPDRSPRRG